MGRRLRVALVLVLALAGAGIALTLTPSTAVDTFVSSSSSDYAATQATYRQFGTDPVVVLVRAPLTSLIQPRALATLSGSRPASADSGCASTRELAAYVPVAASSAHALRRLGESVRQADAHARREGRLRTGDLPESCGGGGQH